MTLVLIAPLVAAAIVLAAAGALRLQRTRSVALVGRVLEPRARQPVPEILYFTGEACTICHTAQTPALERLSGALERAPLAYSIREVDVAAQPALARRYRVMSLPTTVVLSPSGAVVAVNVGFAPAERLRAQLESAAANEAA